jgi:hypothetical protein
VTSLDLLKERNSYRNTRNTCYVTMLRASNVKEGIYIIYIPILLRCYDKCSRGLKTSPPSRNNFMTPSSQLKNKRRENEKNDENYKRFETRTF